MKVLLVLAAYSGVKDSLASGEWRPHGVPAIYRLIEGIARRSDMKPTVVFLVRSYDPRFTRVKRFTIEELGLPAIVLPWHKGLGAALNEFLQFTHVLWLAMRGADVVYATNAGFVSAGLLARLDIAPVVLRFLGIFPIHRHLALQGGFARWFYRAPFSHAICTIDGSGAEYYLPRLLRPDVPFSHLLNGVDRTSVDPAEVAALRKSLSFDDRPVVAFVGRLEDYKGAVEFTDALIELERLRPSRFQGLIVGDGPSHSAMMDRLERAGLGGRVRLVGAVPHDRIPLHLAVVDVFVSLNRYGSLSNANLEALASGKCMLMLAKDPAQHTDELTERLIPDDIVARIPRHDTPQATARALAGLIDEPDEIDRRGRRTAALAADLLENWDMRVERELAVIHSAGEPASAHRCSRVDHASPKPQDVGN